MREMPKEGYVRTTVYLRPENYVKMRELPFNFSEWVNRCLENMLNGTGGEITNLLNEERALRARQIEIRQKVLSIENSSTAQKPGEMARGRTIKEKDAQRGIEFEKKHEEFKKRFPEAYEE